MLFKAAVLWVVGLMTIVPYGTYYLFTEAPRDQYALLITGVLFWVFGYWSVAGPIVAAVRIRRVFRSLEAAHAEGRLKEALRSEETAEAAIDLITVESRLPRFLAARVYRRLVDRLSADAGRERVMRPAGSKPRG